MLCLCPTFHISIIATKAGDGKHKIQINGIRLANRTSLSVRTKPRDICSLCGPGARLYSMSSRWKERLAFNVVFPFLQTAFSKLGEVNMKTKLTIRNMSGYGRKVGCKQFHVDQRHSSTKIENVVAQ